jgi:ABC-2 type transport system permease protein
MFELMLYFFRTGFREKSTLFFCLVFPVMMVFILGNMLAELDNPDERIGTIRIVYCLEEEGSFATGEGLGSGLSQTETTAVQTFIDLLAEHGGIEVAKGSNPDSAKRAVNIGDADAAMIFGTPLNVEVTEGEDVIKNRAVKLIAQGFAREYAAYRAAALSNPEAFMKLAMQGIPDFAAQLSEDKDLGVSRSMIDYYAVTMIVMIIFMGGGIGGATMTFIARQDGSLRRMTASPRGRGRLFIESVFGTLPQSILQAGVVMVLSTLFFGAHYAKTWQGNLFLFGFFILLGIAVSAVFMLVGLFVRVNPYVPLLAIIWALLFVSGSFSKEMYIEGFSEYLPMNIAQTAVFDLTMFGRPGQLLLVAAVSGIVLLAACMVGAALFKRKGIML